MTYQAKYIPKLISPNKYKGSGRRRDPNNWKTGTCVITRDKYYAYLKHRAQAVHRGESYELTFDDWCSLWTDESWSQRGRKVDDLCLTRWDYAGEWSMVNVIICTRRDHFRIKTGKYNNN